MTLIELNSSDITNIKSYHIIYNQSPVILTHLIQYGYHLVRTELAREYIGEVKDSNIFSKTYWSESDLPKLEKDLSLAGFSKVFFLECLEEGQYTEYLDSSLIDNILLASKYSTMLFKAREITNIVNMGTINPDSNSKTVLIDYKQKENLDNLLSDADIVYDLLEYAREVTSDV